MSAPLADDQQVDPIFLQRQIDELQDMLRSILKDARETSSAANRCTVQRQLLGQARELLEEEDNDRIARFMELEALEESDELKFPIRKRSSRSQGNSRFHFGLCFKGAENLQILVGNIDDRAATGAHHAGRLQKPALRNGTAALHALECAHFGRCLI